MWGAPFVGLGARASVSVQKGPELSLFLLSYALISAWVGVSILLVGVHADGVVVDIYVVVVVLVHCCKFRCRHWVGSASFWFWVSMGYLRLAEIE